MGFLSSLFGGKQAAEKTASHNENAVAEQPSTEDAPAAATGISALCPVPGTAMDIAEVADPVFSSKAMGDGIGIKPVSGELVRPSRARSRRCSPRAMRSPSRTRAAWVSCCISVSTRST